MAAYLKYIELHTTTAKHSKIRHVFGYSFITGSNGMACTKSCATKFTAAPDMVFIEGTVILRRLVKASNSHVNEYSGSTVASWSDT